MNKVVLDASAFLAFLLEETGVDVVKKYLPNACMSTVNVAETVTTLCRQGLKITEAQNIIQMLIHDVRDFDMQQALLAAELNHEVKKHGLSLGDRACLALALKTGYSVITADKIWEKLKLNCEIILIR